MGGVVNKYNPVEGFRKLGMNFDHKFEIMGVNENSLLYFDVVAFPTARVYHIKFSRVTGMDSNHLLDWVNQQTLVFKTDNVEYNLEKMTASIELNEIDSNVVYYLDGIVSVWRQPKEEIEITEKDILENKHFQDSVNSKENKGFFNSLKSLFK